MAPGAGDRRYEHTGTGVTIVDGKGSTSGLTSRPIGPLAGVWAEIADPARHHMVNGAVATAVLSW
jgi:hypothetical protein